LATERQSGNPPQETAGNGLKLNAFCFAKVDVEGSNPFSRSTKPASQGAGFFVPLR
jgi:hypothetical protein